MAQRRFIALFALVSAAATAALMLGMGAVRGGDAGLSIAAALTGFIAVIGIVVLTRVVIVVERSRTREQQERAVAALKFKTEVLWAQLEAIERGDTQPEAAP